MNATDKHIWTYNILLANVACINMKDLFFLNFAKAEICLCL